MKKLLNILILTIAIIMLFAPVAHAAYVPVDFVIRVFDMPKTGTLDILIKDKNFLINSWNKEHMVSEEHLDFCIGDYHPLYPYSKNLKYTYKYYDYKTNPYMELKINFTSGHPSDFIIMAEANDTIVTSTHLSHSGGTLISNLQYTDSSLQPTDKKPFILRILVIMFLPWLVIGVLLELIIAMIMQIKERNFLFFINLVTTIVNNILLLLAFKLRLPFNTSFWVLALFVAYFEYLIYKKRFAGKYTERKLLLYTVAANIASCILYQVTNYYL